MGRGDREAKRGTESKARLKMHSQEGKVAKSPSRWRRQRTGNVQLLYVHSFVRAPTCFGVERMAPNEMIGPCTSSDTESSDVPSVVYDPVFRCRYSVSDVLGKGGFAKCHLAMDMAHPERKVALKVVAKFRLNKQNIFEKMRKEVAIHETLEHPHIVKLLNFFEDPVNIYLVLELCVRGTLLEHISRSPSGALPEDAARTFLSQIVDAVSYLHETAGILHRDLKPGNMLLDASYQIKLADFGLAVKISDLSTSSMSICGTPNYISPQVLNHEGHSKESEAWALGCSLFCMLFGKPPFEAQTQSETYTRIRYRRFDYPCEPLISDCARNLINGLLEANMKMRIKMEHIRFHRFFYPEQPRSYTAISYSDGNSNLRQAQEYCVQVPSSGMVLSQAGAHSGDSGMGSDGCLPRSVSVPADPHALFHQVMDGHYYVSDDAACSLDGRLTMISKWVDYTNRLGFACVLSDGTHCVLFTDNSSLSHRVASQVDCERYAFLPNVQQEAWNPFEWTGNEEVDQCLRQKMRIAHNFSSYMDKQLRTAVASGAVEQHLDLLVSQKRRNNVLLMVLARGTAQINFTESHHKLVLNRDEFGHVTVSVILPEMSIRSYRMTPRGTPNRPESRSIQDMLNKARAALCDNFSRPYYVTEC